MSKVPDTSAIAQSSAPKPQNILPPAELSFLTVTMNQVEQKTGVTTSILVMLPPRPSTAPPEIQTPPTIPEEYLQKDAAPASTATASVELNLEANVDVKSVKKRGNEIFIDETTALTGLSPMYPVSKRALQESVFLNPKLPLDCSVKLTISLSSRLHKGQKMAAYVGTGSDREYIFEVPKAILAYFSPTLRPLIHTSTPKSFLLLEKADKKATSWLLRWMLNGGVEKSYDNAPPPMESAIDWDVHRLAVVTRFGIQGLLHDRLVKEVQNHILQGAIKAKDLQWIYKAHVPLPVKQLGNDIASFIVNSVLNGAITSPIQSATQNDILKGDIMEALALKRGKVHHIQRVARQPLTVFQVAFIYVFTSKESPLRKMVTRDLLWLIDLHAVSNDPYHAFARTNAEFDADMSDAVDEAKARKAEYNRGQRTSSNVPQPGKRVNTSTSPKTRHAGNSTYAIAAATARSAALAGPATAVANNGPRTPIVPLSASPSKTGRSRQCGPPGPKRAFVNNPSGPDNQAGPHTTDSNVPTGPMAENNPRATSGSRGQRYSPNQQTSNAQPSARRQPGPAHRRGPSTRQRWMIQSTTKVQATNKTRSTFNNPTANPKPKDRSESAVFPEASGDATPAGAATAPPQTFGMRIESRAVLRITGDGEMERET